jgi:hypothetical protein
MHVHLFYRVLSNQPTPYINKRIAPEEITASREAIV